MENIFGKMVTTIQANDQKVIRMEKGKNIIKMAHLYIKVILLMINMKDLENIFMEMEIIIQGNEDKMKNYLNLKMETIQLLHRLFYAYNI